MPEEDVLEINEPETGDEQPQGGAPQKTEAEKPPPATPAELRELKKQIENQNRRIQELSESERYWAGVAKGAGKDKQEHPEDDSGIDLSEYQPSDKPGELDSPDKFVDALSTQGGKAIETLLRQKGYLPAQEVAKLAAKIARETVGRATQRLSTDAKIVQEFPELQNEESELFAETRKELQELVKLDPAMAKSPAGLLSAARIAKANLAAKKAASGDGEQGRLARIRAQQGTDGHRKADYTDDETEESMLGPEAQSVIRSLGISEKDFRDSRKDLGVRRRR